MRRHILATSGGFLATDRWEVLQPGPTFLKGLELTRKERPRVLFILTASGDSARYVSMSYQALANYSVDVDHLALFPQPNSVVETAIEKADFIWVGGGSVANLLALWRLHNVDSALRSAWESGTVLGGVSAGSICWHVGGPTDSFGPKLEIVQNGLGLLPYGNGVHYDSEAQRRPLLQATVAAGTLPMSFATDDRVGIHYEGIDAVEVISDKPESEAAAYRIEMLNGEVVETRLPVGKIK
ncbi:MAG: hypothetical protein RL038_1038 [Actinomycetota bacterium]